MFYTAILKKPFKKVMDKAIEECKNKKFENKEEEIEFLKEAMELFIERLFENEYNDLKKSGEYTEEILNKRKEKSKKILYSLLTKRIKKMKRKL